MSGSGRPRRACDQCNAQKVRCSTGRPTCQRCLRLDRECTYPTVQTSTRPQRLVSGSSATSSSKEVERDSHVVQNPLSSQLILPDKGYVGIPSQLVSTLVEVYFDHVYNASLLLRKVPFLQALADGNVKQHVLLTICAFASIFYVDGGRRTLKDHGFGIEWAERAGRLALQEAENPQDDNVVTFLNLALFWYSHGSWRRSFMHKGIATNTSHVLGLGLERKGKEQTMESEVRRRRFWACYLMNSFASETPFLTDPSETTMTLTLPWRDGDYEIGSSGVSSDCLKSSIGTESIYGELIKAMTLWSEVRKFIKTFDNVDMSIRMAALYTLDARISEWWSRLPGSFRLDPEGVWTSVSSALPRLLLINAVYHQCLCALHSSVVPLFSWSPNNENWAHARQVAAQVAYEHANFVSLLFEAILKCVPNCGAVPGFVAYTAYCACAIQMPFLWCSKPEIKSSAHTNIRTNVKLIRAIGQYWKFIALLSIHVRYLYEMHAENPTHLEDEPKGVIPSKLRGFRINASRARTSILGHNEILWVKDGYAREGEEILDLDAQDDSQQTSAQKNSLESTSSRSRQELQPCEEFLDYFQPFLDPETFISMPTFDELSTPDMDSFDYWLDQMVVENIS